MARDCNHCGFHVSGVCLGRFMACAGCCLADLATHLVSAENVLDLLQLCNDEVELALNQHGFLRITTGELCR